MKESFSGNKIKVILHVLAWSIILGLPLFISRQWQVGKDFLWFYYMSNIINGLIFYINYLLLVPRFFFRRQRKKYFLTVILMLVFFYFLSSFTGEVVFRHVFAGVEQEEGRYKSEMRNDPASLRKAPGPPRIGSMFFPPFRNMHIINYSFSSFFLVFFSIGLRTLERQGHIEKAQRELEKEKLDSELAFLKNQVSPHFFFNTLNNIYSLIGINAEDSQKAVLKLSKLMRYLLYDSEYGNTKLSNEIYFMKNYIDLMKLRMNEKVALTVYFPEHYEDIGIPPLLFIPFIENAFKHGITYRGRSFITISLTSEAGKLDFRCTNSIAVNTEDNQPGIGLENVKKRLSLLFPGNHDLRITKGKEVFDVNLTITVA